MKKPFLTFHVEILCAIEGNEACEMWGHAVNK